MSQVVNVIETSPGSVTSFEVDVGAASLQENDLIYILLSWRVSGTLAISGYTAIGTKQNTDAYDSQWFCKKATASESNPTASTTGAAATPTAVVVVLRGAESSGTALDAVNAHGNRGGSTGATLTSADLTTTVDDCVILHGVTWDQTSVIAPLADMNRLASGSGCVGVTYKATAGAIPTFTFTGSNASNAGRAWAIAIKNASGGDKPVRLVDGRDYLQKLGGFATLTAGLPDSVSGLTQMDGVMMHTAANLSGGFGSFTLGTGIATGSGWGTPGGAFTSNQRCAVTAWVGTFLAVSSISVTGKIISIPWQVGTTGDAGRVGPKGFVITLVDSSNNWATYQVLPQKDWYASRRGVLVIKPGTTPLLASSLTESGSSGVACDFDHLVNIGYFYQRTALPISDASVQWFCHLPIIENSVCAFVGGGSTVPVTTAIEARYLRGGTPLWQGCPEQVSFQGSGQLVNRIGMQLGDGSTATYSKHTAQSYDIPATDETSWRVGAGGAPLIIKASASDTHDLRSAIITSSILQPFTIDAASSLSASILTTGLSVIGRTFSDLAGYDWTSASWTECDTVAFKNGELTTCTIASPNSAIDGTTGAACSFSANGAVIAGSTISCVKASGAVTGYHAAFGAALTAITINNTTLSGTPGTNKFYSALASGTLTITTDGLGTALADTDVTFIGGSTAVAVIAAPELYQSVAITGLAPTYRLQIFDIEYDLTVSGITVTPTAGATYTHNGITWTVRSASIVAGAGTITVYGTGAPGASGTLTKTGGTGDASVTFSAYAVDGTELYIGVPGATSYTWTDTVAAAAPRVIRVRVMEDGPGTSDAIEMIDAIVGMCGITDGTESVGYLVAAVADDVYNDRGVDGSAITGITIDDTTLRLEIASGTITNYNGTDVLVVDGRDLYAYETYWLGTTAGMRDEARFIEAIDAVNFRCSNFKLKGTSGYPIMINNCFIVDAATGIFSSMVDYSGDPISNHPEHMKAIVVTTSDSVVTGTPATVAAAVAAAAAATPFAANVKQVNDLTVSGTGVPPTYDANGVLVDPGDPLVLA